MFLTLACYNCDDAVYSQEVGVNTAFVAANISWNFFPRISATSCDPAQILFLLPSSVVSEFNLISSSRVAIKKIARPTFMEVNDEK